MNSPFYTTCSTIDLLLSSESNHVEPIKTTFSQNLETGPSVQNLHFGVKRLRVGQHTHSNISIAPIALIFTLK